jgi:hypothetical protein
MEREHFETIYTTRFTTGRLLIAVKLKHEDRTTLQLQYTHNTWEAAASNSSQQRESIEL